MEQLPPELLLHILSYLPIRTIHAVQALSTAFNTLIHENANQVYRSAASLHQFVGGQMLKGNFVCDLKHATRHCFSTWMDDVEDWRSFCKNVFIEEALWNGEKPKNLPLRSRVKTLEACGHTVHRFKVDDEEKTIISTNRRGGLIISSVDTQEVLWSLPASYVPGEAHLEYSNGFFVFDRPGEHMEVWRRSADSMNPKTYIPSNPTASQIEACLNLPSDLSELHQQSKPSTSSAHSSEHYRSSSINPSLSLPRRGAYLPFAILENPQPVKAFRFAYPYLLLASQVLKQAFIWDVPHAMLLEVVDISSPRGYFNEEGDAQAFSAVEISDEHIFVCWTAVLCVYRWRVKGGDQAVGDVVFTYPPAKRSDGVTWSYKVWDKEPIEEANRRPVGETARAWYQPQDAKWIKAENMKYRPTAVHVSPNGKDLVTISTRYLLYVPNFIKVAHNLAFGKPTKKQEIERKRLEVSNLFMLESNWSCTNLAFDGKRAAVTMYWGCFVLNLHDRRNVPSYQYPKRFKGREIQPRVFRIHWASGYEATSSDWGSCLEITDTAIWTTRAKALGWGEFDSSVRMFDISDLKLALPPPPIIRPYSQAVTKRAQKKF